MSRWCPTSPFFLCLALSSLLTACTTLGPDYRQPDPGWLQHWQPGGIEARDPGRDPEDLGFWWQVFDDPVLNQLIEISRRENLPLRIAGLRIFESRAALGIAGSTLYPQLQQFTGAASYVGNSTHGGDTPAGSQGFGSYNLGLNLGWELDFWGRFQRGIEAADAAFFASQANQQDMQVLVSAQMADAYFAYRITQARIGIARKNAEIQKRSFEITETLFRNGEQSELDLQQAKTQYLATLSSIPALEIALSQIRNAMSVLMGRPPGEIPELGDGEYRFPSIDLARLQAIPAQLLNRRPDLRAAAWNIAVQSAQIGIAEADYYPAISLIGSIGWSANSLNSSADVASLLAGPALQWNIFDHGRIANNIRVQDARLQQLIEAYQDAALRAAREVDDALTSVRKTAEQQKLVDASLAASQRALEIANTRYREGYADFQRVLDAQRSMFSQADRQLLTRGNQYAALVALYKSLGGGWKAVPVDELVPGRVRDTMRQRSDWGDLLDAPLNHPNGDSTEEN